MLPDYLLKFNHALFLFKEKFPRKEWNELFRMSLINDFSFYSARVEDSKLTLSWCLISCNLKLLKAY